MERTAGWKRAEYRHVALDGVQSAAAVPRPGSDARSPRVYGCCGLAENLPHRSLLDDAAGVHDGDPVGHLGDDAEVVRHQQQRQAERLPHFAQQFEDFRLDRDVERGRRLVGDDERGLQAMAIAISTRCRMPPDN